MKVLLASFEPRRDTDSSRSTLRSKANPTHEQQAVLEPADQDAGRYEHTLNAHDSIHQADPALSGLTDRWCVRRQIAPVRGGLALVKRASLCAARGGE